MTPGPDDHDEHPSRPFAAPGGSGPGDPGYEGGATLGDEGATAGPESFVDPTATEEEAEAAVSPAVRERWARADAQTDMSTDNQA